MIYFDNAATSRRKSNSVLNSYIEYVTQIGVSPSRGAYPVAITASRTLYQTRKVVTGYFGLSSNCNVCFTKNSTEAINLFVLGYLNEGDHVLLSPYEHNAVLRPIHTLASQGKITYTVLPEKILYDDQLSIGEYIRENTRVAFLTLASNLTGQYVFSSSLSKIVKSKGVVTFVDASQGAGKIPINMDKDHIDFLAFTGHKDLMALPGVGGLCYRDHAGLRPLLQGGMGIHGEDYSNTTVFPEAYEAGTLNMPAIASLKTAIEELNEERDNRTIIEEALMQHLLSQLADIERVKIYNVDKKRVSTIAFNICGIQSDKVVDVLNKHDICVRGGIHCAILAHKAIGTVATGAIRVSINYNNTIQEIDKFISILKEMV